MSKCNQHLTWVFNSIEKHLPTCETTAQKYLMQIIGSTFEQLNPGLLSHSEAQKQSDQLAHHRSIWGLRFELPLENLQPPH